MTNTSRRESDKRVIRTKKAIKGALFRIMETKDLTDITISELADEASVNRRTFYTHYNSITEILDEIEAELIVAMKTLAEGFDKTDCEQSTYDFFIGLNKIISVDFECYFKLLKSDSRGTLSARLKTVIHNAAVSVMDVLTSRQSSERRAIFAFVAGGFFNTYVEWKMSPGDLSIEQAAKISAEMVSSCIKSAKKMMPD